MLLGICHTHSCRCPCLRIVRIVSERRNMLVYPSIQELPCNFGHVWTPNSRTLVCSSSSMRPVSFALPVLTPLAGRDRAPPERNRSLPIIPHRQHRNWFNSPGRFPARFCAKWKGGQPTGPTRLPLAASLFAEPLPSRFLILLWVLTPIDQAPKGQRARQPPDRQSVECLLLQEMF